jgi:hypothetical protein
VSVPGTGTNTMPPLIVSPVKTSSAARSGARASTRRRDRRRNSP